MGMGSLAQGLLFIAELFFAFLSQLTKLTIIFTRSGCLKHAVVKGLGAAVTGGQGHDHGDAGESNAKESM